MRNTEDDDEVDKTQEELYEQGNKYHEIKNNLQARLGFESTDKLVNFTFKNSFSMNKIKHLHQHQ